MRSLAPYFFCAFLITTTSGCGSVLTYGGQAEVDQEARGHINKAREYLARGRYHFAQAHVDSAMATSRVGDHGLIKVTPSKEVIAAARTLKETIEAERNAMNTKRDELLKRIPQLLEQLMIPEAKSAIAELRQISGATQDVERLEKALQQAEVRKKALADFNKLMADKKHVAALSLLSESLASDLKTRGIWADNLRPSSSIERLTVSLESGRAGQIVTLESVLKGKQYKGPVQRLRSALLPTNIPHGQCNWMAVSILCGPVSIDDVVNSDVNEMKGKYVELEATVLQVLGPGQCLVTPKASTPTSTPVILESSHPNYQKRGYLAGAKLCLVGKILGTREYTTVMRANATALLLDVVWIEK